MNRKKNETDQIVRFYGLGNEYIILENNHTNPQVIATNQVSDKIHGRLNI